MIKIISDIKISIVLFLLFACASAIATFIESKYTTPSAWALVYGTWWFGLIQLLLGINLFFAIFRYKMYEKLPLFLFHISFLFILLGSILTRYYGFEGMLHLRQNDTSNIITSQQAHFILSAKKDDKIYSNDISKYISLVGSNSVDLELKIDEKIAKLHLDKIILNAKVKYVESPNGKALVYLNISSNDYSSALALEKGDFRILGKSVLSNDKDINMNGVDILNFKDGGYISNTKTSVFDTITKSTKNIEKNTFYKLENPSVITYKDYKIGFIKEYKSAIKTYEQGDDKNYPNAYEFTLSYDNESTKLYLFENESEIVKLANQSFSLAYTPKAYELPFSFTLDKFELERYEASNSAKSYASFVKLNDENESKEYKIFMNNVLDYKGYRFYQSSYDTDEKGTYLSVNKDPGKFPTYIGYFLLGLGLFLNIFHKKSRFMQLRAKLIKLTSLVLLLSCINLHSNTLENQIQQAAAKLDKVSLEEHAKNLSTLAVRKENSRVAPFGTMALELLEKIHKSTSYKNQDASTTLIKIMGDFDNFINEKFIYLKDKDIRKMLGLEDGKYASFADFFKDRKYALKDEVDRASRLNPNKRGTLEKELLKVDERLNILYYASLGGYLTAFFDENNAKNLLDTDDVKAKAYYAALVQANKDGNYALADKILKEIKLSQNKKYDENKFLLEIEFDKIAPFTKLIPFYLLCGLALLLLIFTKIIRTKEINLKPAFKTVYYLNVLAFIIHTISLAIRGYISNHAPWSNSYESLLYIAWALSLSGIIFSKRSPISLSLTSILAAIVLFVAQLSSIDPQIGNLAPVLQSYWLTIHVSVITASYGFLGLCALLGCFVLILFCMFAKDEKYNEKLAKNIQEATMINEIAMILGLSLLTLGNFLGGVWANESWGRYWGWDSKETWALVSILVYAAVIHTRLVKGINNQFYFAIFSMFAYLSIVMTYFGVNYFLTGMHSYAAGNAASVPLYAYIIVAIMIVLSIIAAKNKSKAKLL